MKASLNGSASAIKAIHEQSLNPEFRQGALWMIEETLATLAQYATALEGLPKQNMTPAKMYDDVRLALAQYYKDIM